MSQTDHNKAVYNAIAKHFSETRSWVTDDLAALGAYARPGDRVLDLACGNARLYQFFVTEGRAAQMTYVGVDFSEKLLELARSRFPNIDVRLGEMTDIPFPDSDFDVVFCLAAFHHLSTDAERLQALREIARVLKPGGTLVMTNWNMFSAWAENKLKAGKWKRGSAEREVIVPWKNADGTVIGERLYYAYAPEDIARWCSEAGLLVEKQYEATKKGSGSMDKTEEGMNIVTIAKRP